METLNCPLCGTQLLKMRTQLFHPLGERDDPRCQNEIVSGPESFWKYWTLTSEHHPAIDQRVLGQTYQGDLVLWLWKGDIDAGYVEKWHPTYDLLEGT